MLCMFSALWLTVSVSQTYTLIQLRYSIDSISDTYSSHVVNWSKQQFPFKNMWNLSRR